MKNTILPQMDGYDVVSRVAVQIADLLGAKAVYLYNHRLSAQGRFTTFKLAVVVDLKDKTEAERRIYREVDSDLPFDTILYTPGEWEALKNRKTAFAKHICDTGHIVYEQA